MTSSTFDVAVCCSSNSRKLVQQTRIFDGDDRLGGEILQQRNLLVGERPYLLTIYGDCSNKCVFLEHRHNREVFEHHRYQQARRAAQKNLPCRLAPPLGRGRERFAAFRKTSKRNAWFIAYNNR